LAETIATARAAHDPEIEVLALDALAYLLAAQGDEAGARTTLAAADAVLPQARHLLADADLVDRARISAHPKAAPSGR
jgi:hypothetical protein